jgi:hypothetical protein
MAKIIFSNGAEIRGTIGGTTYSRNASGAYARNYVKPVNANTAKQQFVRNQFSSVSNAYRSLTLAQRQSYKDMAPFYTRVDSVGNVVTPTASQLFARINGALLQNGYITTSGFLTICPVPVSISNPSSLTATSDIPATELKASTVFGNNTTTVPADTVLIISATPAISAGIKSVPNNSYSRIGVVEGGDDTATADFYSAYVNNFGVPSLNGVIHVKVQLMSIVTGQLSTELESICVVTP